MGLAAHQFEVFKAILLPHVGIQDRLFCVGVKFEDLLEAPEKLSIDNRSTKVLLKIESYVEISPKKILKVIMNSGLVEPQRYLLEFPRLINVPHGFTSELGKELLRVRK